MVALVWIVPDMVLPGMKDGAPPPPAGFHFLLELASGQKSQDVPGEGSTNMGQKDLRPKHMDTKNIGPKNMGRQNP